RNAHYDELSATQRGVLEEDIQQLYDFHDRFAGDAIQNTLDAMKGDLSHITDATRQATQALQHLKTIERVVAIVAAAATLAEDIVLADYGAIPLDLRSLVQATQPPVDKNS